MSGERRQGVRRRGFAAARGWTLLELLVVLAVIGILLALLLCAVQAIRETARRAQCGNQIRQITTALANYETAWHCYPPGWSAPAMTMWSGFLLPYLEQNNLYETLDLQGPWNGSAAVTTDGNAAALAAWIALLQCPSSGLPPTQWDGVMACVRTPCSYLACASGSNNRESGTLPWCGMNAWRDPQTGATYPASDGVFYLNSRTRPAEIVDGLSHTLLVGETLPDQNVQADDYAGNWQKVDHWFIGSSELFEYSALSEFGSAENSECLGSTACPINALDDPSLPMNDRELSYGSRHVRGVNLGLADGQVRFVSSAIDRPVWQALGTRAARDSATE